MNKIMSAHAVGAVGAVVAILVLVQCAEAKTYVVGEEQGWRVPSDASFYRTWETDKKFAVGDILMFNFTTGQHNVVEVPKESYDSCSASNAIYTTTVGPANITLNKSGQRYYICSIPTHCNGGQKLAIDVSGSPSPANSPNPPPSDGTTPPPPSPSSSAAPITTTTTTGAFASFLLLFFSTFMVVMF